MMKQEDFNRLCDETRHLDPTAQELEDLLTSFGDEVRKSMTPERHALIEGYVEHCERKRLEQAEG